MRGVVGLNLSQVDSSANYAGFPQVDDLLAAGQPWWDSIAGGIGSNPVDGLGWPTDAAFTAIRGPKGFTGTVPVFDASGNAIGSTRLEDTGSNDGQSRFDYPGQPCRVGGLRVLSEFFKGYVRGMGGGTWRPMDWLQTNWYFPERLVTEAHSIWSRQGPLSILAREAQALSADLWLNIHHLAGPGYLDDVAGQLRDGGYTRRVLVSDSNEVWNGDRTGGFPAAGWHMEHWRNHPALQGLGLDDQLGRFYLTLVKTVEFTRALRQRGVDALAVFEWQFDNEVTWVLDRVWSDLPEYAAEVHALAWAPYVNAPGDVTNPGSTWHANAKRNTDWANAHGLQTFAYEYNLHAAGVSYAEVAQGLHALVHRYGWGRVCLYKMPGQATQPLNWNLPADNPVYQAAAGINAETLIDDEDGPAPPVDPSPGNVVPVRVRAEDGRGGSVEFDVPVEVRDREPEPEPEPEPNRDPVVASVVSGLAAFRGESLVLAPDVDFAVTDPDGDALSYMVLPGDGYVVEMAEELVVRFG